MNYKGWTNNSDVYEILRLLELLKVSNNNRNYDVNYWKVYWERLPNASNNFGQCIGFKGVSTPQSKTYSIPLTKII